MTNLSKLIESLNKKPIKGSRMTSEYYDLVTGNAGEIIKVLVAGLRNSCSCNPMNDKCPACPALQRAEELAGGRE